MLGSDDCDWYTWIGGNKWKGIFAQLIIGITQISNSKHLAWNGSNSCIASYMVELLGR